ncbi:major facilitator superfamily domain-containing protein [Chytriomyces sp. MP71]|nr:major facilitator superfamily domain-containing protein [Chytriomyces sp. MP71]
MGETAEASEGSAVSKAILAATATSLHNETLITTSQPVPETLTRNQVFELAGINKDSTQAPSKLESISIDIVDVTSDITAAPPAFDIFTQVKVPLSRFEFVMVFVSMMLGVFLAALDQTIVATALKAIVADLGGQSLLPWIGSAYMLSSCALCTMYGKFADLFGRKATFLMAVAIFELGSVICAVSTSMAILIAGRAVAGIGGGGIMSLCLIMLSDIVSIQDRGKYQGFIGGTYSFASVVGPLIGGVFVDRLTWRWCFWINLPIGFLTFAIVLFLLKLPSPEGNFNEKLRRVDFVGITLLTIAIVLLLVPLQLGGGEWAWNAWYTIVSFITSIAFFAIFAVYEGRIDDANAIVPYSIFSNSSVPALLFIAICVGGCLFPAMYYVALFFQVVQGATATVAGVKSVPLILGVVIVSVSSGLFVSKTGQYKILFFIGPVVMCLGIVLLSTLNQNSTDVMNVFYLFIMGMGVGPLNSIGVVAIQSSVDSSKIAVATAVQRTCQQLGGALGVSIIGTIFNSILTSSITTGAPDLPAAIAGLRQSGVILDPTEVFQVVEALQGNQTLPVYQNALNELVSGFVIAFHYVFLWLLPFCIMIPLLNGFFVRQFELKSKKK